MLLDLGNSHMQATAILVAISGGFLLLVFLFQSVGSLNLILIQLSLAILGSILLKYLLKQKTRNNQSEAIMQSKVNKSMADIEI